MDTRTCVILGDEGVGKSSILEALAKNLGLGIIHEAMHQMIIKPIGGFGEEMHIKIIDIDGDKVTDSARQSFYELSDCFLVCFAIDDDSSFFNAKNKWIPEIKHRCPQIPILLVGTKADLKIMKLCVPKGQIERLVDDWKLSLYLECSIEDPPSIGLIYSHSIEEILDSIGVKSNNDQNCQIL